MIINRFINKPGPPEDFLTDVEIVKPLLHVNNFTFGYNINTQMAKQSISIWTLYVIALSEVSLLISMYVNTYLVI